MDTADVKVSIPMKFEIYTDLFLLTLSVSISCPTDTAAGPDMSSGISTLKHLTLILSHFYLQSSESGSLHPSVSIGRCTAISICLYFFFLLLTGSRDPVRGSSLQARAALDEAKAPYYTDIPWDP